MVIGRRQQQRIDAAGKATAKVTAVPPVVVKGFNLGDTNSDSVIVAAEKPAIGSA